MPFTMRGTLGPPLLVATAAGLLATRLGPYGTFSDLSPGERAAYWVGLTLLLGVQILVALHLLRPLLTRLDWRGVGLHLRASPEPSRAPSKSPGLKACSGSSAIWARSISSPSTAT